MNINLLWWGKRELLGIKNNIYFKIELPHKQKKEIPGPLLSICCVVWKARWASDDPWNVSLLPLGSHTFGGVLSVYFGSASGLCWSVAHRSTSSWLQKDGGHTIHPESTYRAPSSSSDVISAVMPLHKSTSSAASTVCLPCISLNQYRRSVLPSSCVTSHSTSYRPLENNKKENVKINVYRNSVCWRAAVSILPHFWLLLLLLAFSAAPAQAP